MASMAQPFNPAMSGPMATGGQPMVHHPSGQGMPGAGQAGVTMGQQIHPGMTGTGMPQVSQAGPTMGMMPSGAPPGAPGGPGGHPNAHAMQHLTPSQSQMFAQPQQMQQSKFNIFFYLSSCYCYLMIRSGLPR